MGIYKRAMKDGELDTSVRIRGFTPATWRRLRLHAMLRGVTIADLIGSMLLDVLKKWEAEGVDLSEEEAKIGAPE